ncbi:MAG: hypothetical protein H0X02_08070 [Nitrosomonas sp.]|nr:hypothetical protein [Nitrosomonas sp.]
MQTWKTTTLPSRWQASQAAIRQLMPDWRYVLLTDVDNLAFVKLHFPDFLNTFIGFEYDIQRADAIRYMWLYVNGGVYLDLDLQPLKSFNKLFDSLSTKTKDKPDLYVVKSSIVNGVYTNAFMAAQPKLPVMLRCLELMKPPNPWWHWGKHLKVVNRTGPNMWTHAIQQSIAEEKLPKLHIAEIPTALIIPCSICEVNGCKLDGAYCKTLGGSSWSGADTKLFALVYCNRQALAIFFLIIVVVVLIINRYRRKRGRLISTKTCQDITVG